MTADAASHVDRLQHHLRTAGLDADRYTQGVIELLECRPPSVLMTEDRQLLDLLHHKVVCLLGSLDQAKRVAKELDQLGVVL